MTRSVFMLASLVLLGAASFGVLSFAQDQQGTGRGMMGSGSMMGNGGMMAPGMMGNGGMMEGMMGRGCCAGMMAGGGMMGGMGHSQRPNEQWRGHPAPIPASDHG